MPARKTLTIAAGIALSFVGFVAAVAFLSRIQAISVTVAKLMLVALVGLYFGFGVLIAVHRLIRKLD
jgi:hypothetical protein